MPVQFSCPHCGQLLSVTRRKIGHAVQCARCQGGVIVPAPLASGEGDLDSENSEEQDESTGVADPELELAEPQMLAEESESLARMHALAQGNSAGQLRPGISDTVHMTRTALYFIGGLIAAVAIISFLVGWSFGSNMVPVAQQVTTRTVRGHVHFTTRRGQQAADSESVAIAFPVSRKPDEKLQSAEIRPDVAPGSVSQAVVQAIRSLGGDYARTDRDGGYQLQLGQSGPYYLLIISNHVARPVEQQPTTKEVVELGQFVTRATELLSGNAYSWEKQMIMKSIEHNHVFENE